jgi:hypothetical protein
MEKVNVNTITRFRSYGRYLFSALSAIAFGVMAQ